LPCLAKVRQGRQALPKIKHRVYPMIS